MPFFNLDNGKEARPRVLESVDEAPPLLLSFSGAKQENNILGCSPGSILLVERMTEACALSHVKMEYPNFFPDLEPIFFYISLMFLISLGSEEIDITGKWKGGRCQTE